MFEPNDYLKKVVEFATFRNLTPKTLENYLCAIRLYLNWLLSNNILPENATYDDIRTFLLHYKLERNWTNRSVNIYISKIRFFQLYVLEKDWNYYQVPFLKIDINLPIILAQKDMIHFINTLPHLKIKAICSLMYGSGLRVSEVRRLEYHDISRKNMQIYIRPSKSRQDRYAILSKTTLDILSEYWKVYGKPMALLFPNATGEKAICTQTVDYHIKRHLKQLGWSEKLSPHSFRHAFGTHLYENGTDLLTIQKLLGHKSIRSTTIYVQLASLNKLGATSPMDWR
ncbi:hypothetical protein EZV73_05600 [Acidaminobacter sp. JC074]|uniref:tyrosine-type recombinase/integrase n=1 Tax=Acidaminobacter sp. JC074 TaxID=2530199 RepID=UPI001F117951|nr:site-specific integrase [Acidaminobacter sp. JC074]MCH4887032.1 hypothetical protein [Acidaminobacter sp. JC074]